MRRLQPSWTRAQESLFRRWYLSQKYGDRLNGGLRKRGPVSGLRVAC
jgi:hypothetical protein